MAGCDGDGRQFKDVAGSHQSPPGVGVILVVVLWKRDGGRGGILTPLYDLKSLFLAWMRVQRQHLSIPGPLALTADLMAFKQRLKTVQSSEKTYRDAKQGPLDSCPSVLPPINDQDETYARRRQAGNTEGNMFMSVYIFATTKSRKVESHQQTQEFKA